MIRRGLWIAAAVAAIIVGALLVFLVNRSGEATVRPLLTLRVNRTASAEIVAGTPLTFEVFLTATSAGQPVSLGSAGRPWYELIQVESADAGATLPWSTAHLGSPRSTSYAKDGTGRLSPVELTQAVATVSGLTSVHVVDYGVSPEDSARTQTGLYRVRAVLSPPWWMVWRWHRRVMSAPVTISIIAGAEDASQAHTRVRESAAFYLEAHRYPDARQTALQWLRSDPQSSDAYAILGEAQEGEGNKTDAMKSYRKALALRGPSREAPRYLESRLEALMQGSATDASR